MIYQDFQGLKLSALGMGAMRLPPWRGMIPRWTRLPPPKWWPMPWTTG